MWVPYPERGRRIQGLDGLDKGFRDAKPEKGGGDGFVRNCIKGLCPVQKEHVDRCIMPVEQLQNAAYDMDRLRARPAYSEAKLMWAQARVEGTLQPSMQHTGINLEGRKIPDGRKNRNKPMTTIRIMLKSSSESEGQITCLIRGWGD